MATIINFQSNPGSTNVVDAKIERICKSFPITRMVVPQPERD